MNLKYALFFIGLIVTFSLCSIKLNAAEIIEVKPHKGKQGQDIRVTIYGLNTHFTQSTNTIEFNASSQIQNGAVYNFQATSSLVLNDYTLVAFVQIPNNASVEFYDVYVNNRIDGEIIKEEGFLVTSPNTYINNIQPNQSSKGLTLNVTLFGIGTHFSQASNVVEFRASTTTYGMTTATFNPFSLTALNDNELIAHITIPSDVPEGYYDVSVINSIDGLLLKFSAFEVLSSLFKSFNEYFNIEDSAKIVSEISIYPNPSFDIVFIELTENLKKIELFNIEGKKQFVKPVFTKYNKISINTENLTNGEYILSVELESGAIERRILIKN